ncbi:HAMP domain-containing sensor histidine kinase [Alicyclobacillus suci]|uniref:HAMP domain-containing sensor histidine kinase n=1 Tax=Alicyclobacillus suci TaxID=2816080 RepID=UPI001A90912E|nr:HAMP domain-containing sensor histidine kinase [Alicyclobacillus suci]
MKIEKDKRVTTQHVSWRTYIWTFCVLEILSTGQGLIYGSYIGVKNVPGQYFWSMAGYWAIVSFVFCVVINRQRIRFYDRPMRRLSEAAKQVAEGDFTVCVEPLNRADKKDYVDVMFEDFNKMVEQLGSIETLKRDFISNVSHEIKTPLSVIQSYAMALQKGNLTPENCKDYTDTIISASNKLTTLVTNILKLSKLENQEVRTSLVSYDLCRQLCDCALAFENLWEEKNIKFEVDIEDHAMIYADASMLEIVWNNLLSNALKFTDQGGRVTLKQISTSDSIIVSVSDTGRGISDEAVSRIFDRFYQGDTSHYQEGNGLGLALVRKAIEIVQGRISVSSTLGVGTTFTVYLNVKDNGTTDVLSRPENQM